MKETRVIFRSDLPIWAVLLVAAACVVLAALAYRRTTRPVSPRMKAVLVGLRLVALGALLVCLIRPALETTTYTVQKRPMILLVDRSRSMSEIRDTPDGSSRLEAVERALAENEEKIEALKGRYEVTTLGFARDLLDGDGADEGAANYSAYGRALRDALRRAPPGQCDAVVLIGDGSHNLDPPDPVDAAATLAERGVPLYTVGVGREAVGGRLRDVQLAALEAPHMAPVNSTFLVRGRLRLRGCRGLTVKVRLELPGQPVEIQSFRAGHDEELLPVMFEVTPEKPGIFKLTMRALEVEGEALPDNNVLSAYVKVTSDALRVGYFDSLRPESKFAYQALRGAKQMAVTRVAVAGRRPLNLRDTDWERYDVVVLGDVSAASLRAEDLEKLRDAVLETGKGLVLLAAPESAGRVGLGGTVVGELLPVELGREWRYRAGDVRFRVESQFASHPIVSLAAGEGESLERWRAMPALGGYVEFKNLKPGATVLARAGGGAPVLVVQRAGAGRVVCLMTDTTFHWFFTEADTQDEHRRFWRQMVMWAGGWEARRRERLWITLSGSRPGVGEPLGIEAHLVGPDDQPVRDAQVRLELTGPDGLETVLEPLFSRERGAFQARFSPPIAGEYTVHARAERGGKVIDVDLASFQAVSTDRELEEPGARLSLLRRLSAATSEVGGEYYALVRIDRLLKELARRGEPVRLSTRRWEEVWDSVWIFALFLCALGAEWGLRRWKGLV